MGEEMQGVLVPGDGGEKNTTPHAPLLHPGGQFVRWMVSSRFDK